ncbi:DUF2637 domain-containing protein [Phytomonospora sp. NPDC050363]|uniref:DUF2637 domain-containing protein n=1 Tax=Phytomonospora sp. NPDC050363 TaxID=3155642 RepID=UPI0034044DAA
MASQPQAQTPSFGHVVMTGAASLVVTTSILAVVAAAFALSFDATTAVAQAAHMRAELAWLLSIAIDGAMMVGAIAALVMQRIRGSHRAALYPWSVVGAGALISIACNGLHAIGEPGAALELSPDTRFIVSAIPAVMLALTVHLVVELINAVTSKPRRADTTPDTTDTTPNGPNAAPVAPSNGVRPVPAAVDTTTDSVTREPSRELVPVDTAPDALDVTEPDSGPVAVLWDAYWERMDVPPNSKGGAAAAEYFRRVLAREPVSVRIVAEAAGVSTGVTGNVLPQAKAAAVALGVLS